MHTLLRSRIIRPKVTFRTNVTFTGDVFEGRAPVGQAMPADLPVKRPTTYKQSVDLQTA